jgi:hypothetical protein
VSLNELADTRASIADRIAIPIIIDADDGLGNAVKVQRTIRLLERSGASAIQIEDQAAMECAGLAAPVPHHRGFDGLQGRPSLLRIIRRSERDSAHYSRYRSKAAVPATPKAVLRTARRKLS